MFQSLSRGWGFLKQSIEMAAKDRDLIKPSLMSVAASIVVSLILSIPLIAVAFIFGESGLGQVLLFIFGALLIFAQFVVSYIFAGMTVYLIYGYLAEGDGRMDKAWDYITTAYHTCLFLWARDVEKAQAEQREARSVAAPAPLAAVLGS